MPGPLRRLIAFVRWSRDAGARDALWALLYPLKTWRCRLFGHRWGAEKSDYEPNIGARLQSWHDCERPSCEGWRETYHYAEGEIDRVVG